MTISEQRLCRRANIILRDRDNHLRRLLAERQVTQLISQPTVLQPAGQIQPEGANQGRNRCSGTSRLPAGRRYLLIPAYHTAGRHAAQQRKAALQLHR